jgi:hypothetical protein
MNPVEENQTLKYNLDSTNKINDIRLSLRSDAGSKIVWILVEGDDDCKIYPKFFKETNAKIEFVNGGKGQLNIALATLTCETKQVIGIQDADFLHLEKNYPNTKNLFFTDYHDIEMKMLNFDNIRDNLFTEYRISDNRQEIWNNVLEESSYIAYIRWYNEKNRCRIKFEKSGYEGIIDKAGYKITLKKKELLDKLNNRSSNKTESLTTENVSKFVAENHTNDLLNLCNGHDVAKLLSLIIGSQINYKSFCGDLRLSFRMEEFSETKLYATIYDWQNKNGFSILKQITQK